jgi:hypothetical protein
MSRVDKDIMFLLNDYRRHPQQETPFGVDPVGPQIRQFARGGIMSPVLGEICG